MVIYLSLLVRDSGKQNKLKKFLTNEMRFDKISKLSLEKNDRNLDN